MAARAGRYGIVGTIATGGMATVYLGKAVGVAGFERLVAIKIMHQQFAADSEYVTMFLDEARLAARIRHPNVVATLDVQHDDELFIVMDYIEGPSLSAVLRKLRKQRDRLPLGLTLRIMIDALNGLQAAHELCDDEGRPIHIVHRDVSPQNILVGVDGISRITDFGVAKAAVRMGSTRSGQLKGKIGYMAPEQVRGERVDRRADVFAAGVVMWESLTGRRLFKADNEAAVVLSLIEGAKESPREINVDVTPRIDAACMRALSVDPRDRYPTAADFVEALETAAFEDNVAIASARSVAGYIKAIDAHPSVELASDPRSLRIGPRESDLSEPAASGLSRAGAVISHRPAPPAPKSRGPLYLTMTAVGALGVVGYTSMQTGRASVAVSNMVPDVRAAAAPPIQNEIRSPSPSAEPESSAEPTSSAQPAIRPPPRRPARPGRPSLEPAPKAPNTFETKEL